MMQKLGRKLGALLLGLSACQTQGAVAAPAFPGAVGYGAGAKGGRGGAVYLVTNRNDGGWGSLRACVEASGPRTCVFRVGGTITVTSPIVVSDPYLTIAGQTAPGGGIQVRNASTSSDADAPIYLYNTHDVVIRHLRLRPGRGMGDADALSIENSHDVIIDHVSLYWGEDENLGASGDRVADVTVQWSILAEGLETHSKGALLCNGDGTVCQRITSYANIYSSNRDRNPNVDMTRSPFDLVNNVVYNAYSEFLEVHDSAGGSLVNIVGNTFRRGPSTGSGADAITYHADTGPAVSRLYASGNVHDLAGLADADARRAMASAPVARLSVAAMPAATAYQRVLAGAGAWPRDAADARIVRGIINRAGAIISNEAQVGGWPVLAAGTSPTDVDRDGMADGWERTVGLDPSSAADRNGDKDRDGYTNLEEYLASRAAAITAR